MPAPYQVIWSDESLENVDAIVAYLEERWSQREVDSFLERLQEQEIITYPTILKPIHFPKKVMATGGVY